MRKSWSTYRSKCLPKKPPRDLLRMHPPTTQELWSTLLECRRLRLPMGCATAGDPALREVGLCGMHAYSVLDAREVATGG